MRGFEERCIEVHDPPDADKLIAWAQERLRQRDFPAQLTSPWMKICDSEKFLTSTLSQAAGRGWVRSAALFLLRRFRAALALSKREGRSG